VTTRTIKDTVLPTIFRGIPISVLETLTTANPVVAYYHIVSDKDVPHVKHLYRFRSVSQFENDLDAFLKVYEPIGLLDLLHSVSADKPLPRHAFLLTFDDGFRELSEVIAPLLLRKGIPATFFLATAFLDNKEMALHNELSVLIEHVKTLPEKRQSQINDSLSKRQLSGENVSEKLLSITYQRKHLVPQIAKFVECDLPGYLRQTRPYLTCDEVRKMIAQGFTIGAHSVDHPLYSALTLKEQLQQTSESVSFLRQKFGLNYSTFSFPHGDSNVGAEFFKEIYAKGILDISFGSAGMLKEAFPRHFQRFSPENSSMPVDSVLRRHYARSLYKKLLRRQVINRTQAVNLSSFGTLPGAAVPS
jgi:peptidoglycan/xylan/chitin deacetylase (PgdA/CDA1 family)